MGVDISARNSTPVRLEIMDPLEEGRFLTPDEVSIYFSWLQNLPNLIKPLMRMPAT